jgi:hypothetical protein
MKTRTRILLAAALGVWLTMPNTNRIHDPVRSPERNLFDFMAASGSFDSLCRATHN